MSDEKIQLPALNEPSGITTSDTPKGHLSQHPDATPIEVTISRSELAGILAKLEEAGIPEHALRRLHSFAASLPDTESKES
jgi:hypothetical protein